MKISTSHPPPALPCGGGRGCFLWSLEDLLFIEISATKYDILRGIFV
jgi:hypothetical protein